MAELSTDVRYLSGIGEARAKKLNKLGIFTLEDLITFFPRAYEDRTVFKPIGEVIPGESVCVAAIVADAPTLTHVRRGMDLVKTRIVDDKGSMNVTFFNQAYMQKSLVPGEGYIFYGKVSGTAKRPELINPIVESEKSERRVTGRIMPIYRLTEGITQSMMTKALAQGIASCGEKLPDPLPSWVVEKYRLARSRYAYETVHFPKSYEELDVARRRLIFEELFILSCALSQLRRDGNDKEGRIIPRCDMTSFFASLPYELTGAQKRAINDAISDMERTRPMSRLVQGDVGSGKTVVAAACFYNAWKAGVQSAMMAPTEILAEQHYETLGKMLGTFGMRVGLLKGSMTAAEKRTVRAMLASGEIDLIVGTHAILSETVKFKSLALVVTDEQHRFGVKQRAVLSEKGESPHVMVMSATPIPRTLAMMIYGDLDISVIDELPPGRQKIDTFLVGEEMRERIYAFMRKLVSEGRQVYVVCPMVEEAEDGTSTLKSVKEYAEKLTEVFSDLSVALIHGRMKGKEKESVMNDFASGRTDILISTTVIEVGVDVPNATLMVIENAERFGLSQLHQLRGRVGRGREKSYCILFGDTKNELTRRRLKAFCATNDGFVIAEEDLRLRGPGDFFGSRQHGLPELKIANLAGDMTLLHDAQEAAKTVTEADPQLSRPENRALREYISKMLEKSSNTIN